MNEELKAALIALGLTEAQATTHATLVTITEESNIEEIAKQIKAVTPVEVTQSEMDRRVTQGITTALENYEKKHGLKDGKVIKVDTPPPPPSSEGQSPEMQLMMETLTNQNKTLVEMSETVKTLSAQKSIDERSIFVKKALTDAKIPEKLHKRFIDKSDATSEEFEALVLEYKQELADSGIEMLQTPGGGSSPKTLELAAEKAANLRNNGDKDKEKGVVQGKEL